MFGKRVVAFLYLQTTDSHNIDSQNTDSQNTEGAMMIPNNAPQGAWEDAPEPADTSDVNLESTLDALWRAHPHAAQGPSAELMRCVEACIACATACTACADACLAEEALHDLASCVLMNTDCADICHATGQVLMRRFAPDWQVLRKQVEACKTACRRCAARCEHHAALHEHCRVSGEVCRRCHTACEQLLAVLPA